MDTVPDDLMPVILATINNPKQFHDALQPHCRAGMSPEATEATIKLWQESHGATTSLKRPPNAPRVQFLTVFALKRY